MSLKESIAHKLAQECDDMPILMEILNDFDALPDKEKRDVLVIVLGHLSSAREHSGYGPKAVGAK